MRINKFVAQSLHISRRKADALIDSGRITINGTLAHPGDKVDDDDTVLIDNTALKPTTLPQNTIILHKPVGFVCSKNGQGSPTVYELLPPQYQHLNHIGRLDKDSSGLLLLTSDGDLHMSLSHPRHSHIKKYHIMLDTPLKNEDYRTITTEGVVINGDHRSAFSLSALRATDGKASGYAGGCITWEARLTEGKNRQIRRTFSALGYTVISLRRVSFGPFELGNLKEGHYRVIPVTRTQKLYTDAKT